PPGRAHQRRRAWTRRGCMSDEHERRVTQPPRAFDDEADDQAGAADPAVDEAAESDASDGGPDDPEPEVIAESVEPEAPAAFEDLSELPSLREALLLVADHPIATAYLARAIEVSVPRVEHALDALAEALREGHRGIRLQRGPQGIQLVSAPEASAQVE